MQTPPCKTGDNANGHQNGQTFAGRINLFQLNWRALANDHWVLQTVMEGYHIHTSPLSSLLKSSSSQSSPFLSGPETNAGGDHVTAGETSNSSNSGHSRGLLLEYVWHTHTDFPNRHAPAYGWHVSDLKIIVNTFTLTLGLSLICT